jgi:hypothetical protein
LKLLLPNRTDYKIGITQKNQTSKISFFDSLGRTRGDVQKPLKN